MTRHVHAVGVAALAVTALLAGCTSGAAGHPTGGSSEPAGQTPSAAPSLATAIPADAGTTFLSTTVGDGQRSLGPIPAAGNVNFVVACLGSGVEVQRQPDIDFTITCDGAPHAVGIQAAARGDQPLVVAAAGAVTWAINAAMVG